MNIDVASIVERARAAAAESPKSDPGSERARLERIAQEFESMLLVQVLRGMRTSGSWEEEDGGDTLGAESMYETLDVELASHLARVQGLGLSKEMLAAFDRLTPKRQTTPDAAADVVAPRVEPPPSYVPPPTHSHPDEPEPVEEIGETVSPVAGDVTSAFGWRRDPFTGRTKFHRGVDLRAAYGEDVFAAGGGRVLFSGQQGGYGTTVLIEHADGTRTRYAHLSVALVGAGDAVASGQPVGRAGRSGRATGTHLHFEVTDAAGRPVDPARFTKS